MKENVKKYLLSPIWFHLVGFIFVFFQITGYLLAKNGTIDWNIFLVSIIMIVSLLGGIPIGYFLFWICSNCLEKISYNNKRIKETHNGKNRSVFGVSILCWLIIMLCWLPLFLAYYPGMCGYDFAAQLAMFINGGISTHHPVLHTELIGKLWLWSFDNYKIGTTGVAVYTIIQMILFASALTYAIMVLKMLGMKDKWCFITASFLGLFPLNGFMAISVTKDTLFSAFLVVLFMAVIYSITTNAKNWFYWFNLFVLVISVAGTVAFRNNGRYAVLILCLGFFFMAVFEKNNRIRYIWLGVLIVISFMLSVSGLKYIERNFWHDPNGEREKYSVPFQQVLRTIEYHEKDLDEEVLEYLKQCVAADFDLTNGYEAACADSIKACFKAEYLKSAKTKEIYFELLKQHPGEYLNAFLALNAGYLYLFDTSCHLPYVEEIEKGNGYILTNENIYWLSTVEVYKESKLPWLYNWMEEIVSSNALMKIPVLGQILAPAIWFYLLLFIVAASLTFEKRKQLLPMALLGGYYATIFLGPMVLMRYVYPVVLCIIVYLFRCGEMIVRKHERR